MANTPFYQYYSSMEDLSELVGTYVAEVLDKIETNSAEKCAKFKCMGKINRLFYGDYIMEFADTEQMITEHTQ